MAHEQFVERIITAARDRDIAPVALTMADIAQATGYTRSTLYRTYGSRSDIFARLRAAGYEVGDQASAHQRAIDAAHQIVQEQGVQALTLDLVADRAGVAVPTVYGRFQNRSGLMRAVFARYSPIPRIARVLPEEFPGSPVAFQAVIERIYGEIWEFFAAESRMVLAIVVEVLREPDGEVMQWLRTEYLGQVANTMLPFMARAIASGMIISPSPLLASQSLAGPMVFHWLTRPIVSAGGHPVPNRDEVCSAFAAAFCRGLVGESFS